MSENSRQFKLSDSQSEISRWPGPMGWSSSRSSRPTYPDLTNYVTADSTLTCCTESPFLSIESVLRTVVRDPAALQSPELKIPFNPLSKRRRARTYKWFGRMVGESMVTILTVNFCDLSLGFNDKELQSPLEQSLRFKVIWSSDCDELFFLFCSSYFMLEPVVDEDFIAEEVMHENISMTKYSW